MGKTGGAGSLNLLKRDCRPAYESFVGDFPAKRQHAIQVEIEGIIQRKFVESVHQKGAMYIELPADRSRTGGG